MPSRKLFAEHIDSLNKTYQDALAFCKDITQSSILIHSGSEQYYYADDRGIPFQAYGHFLQWLPVNKPDQFLLFSPGNRPRYLQTVPADFWHDQAIDTGDWWQESFDIVRLQKPDEITRYVSANDTIYLGQEPATARDILGSGLTTNPSSLLNYLDYKRAYKTEYEVSQLRMANKLSLVGHRAAKLAFDQGHNEYQIHQAYLQACEVLEYETPYTNIVALDQKSAILHYQHKRNGDASASQVLLIDAGIRVNGYGSDITRTYAKRSAHPIFRQLLQGMELLEQELVAAVAPGGDYVDIHLLALHKISTLLNDLQIVKADIQLMLEQQIPQLFMPHGVGHLLGIQVHDVAGFQQDLVGTTRAAPEHSPALRNTRLMEKDMVFTIEPGCYFISLLLEPERNTSKGKMLNWKLIDELYQCGGIRIEDNIRVTEAGSENLTRTPQ